MMTTANTIAEQISELDITEEDVKKAEDFKQKANTVFAEKKFSEAIELYTEAISYNPKVAAYYGNRSFAYIKIELYGAAIKDAEYALSLDPKYIKAYYRRAVCNMALGNLKDAVTDYKSVVKCAPHDADARAKLIECEKEYKRREFEKAISSEENHRRALDLLGDIDSIEVESSYSGPNLSDPNVINLEFVLDLLKHMKMEKKLHKKYLFQIMRSCLKFFESQPPVVDITIPNDGKITVCGDVHGQYYDLLNIFEKNGYPSPKNIYLFNGDFVDRGSFSVECIVALLAFKHLYPDALFLTRGNHETNSMNSVYGFEKECKVKYSENTFKLFSELFDALPLAHLINNKIFVVHGGLFSRDNVTIDELRKIDRFRQPPNEGLMCEMLWSDPKPDEGRSLSKRGVGIMFGPDVTENFCQTNDLKCVIRSHEVMQNGYSIAHNGKCITIFSAPNYCDSVGNAGAYINITPDLEMDFVRFQAVPHPNVKPMLYAGAFGNMV